MADIATDGKAAKTTPPARRVVPAGPKGLPILGNVVAFGRDQLGFLDRCSRDFGDVISLNFVGRPVLVVSDLDTIDRILLKERKNFAKSELIWRHARSVFGNGLLTSEGEIWQRQRKLAAPAFAGQQLLDYGPEMVAIGRQMVDRWSDGQVFDIHPEMMKLALRVAAKTLFDSTVEQDLSDMDTALNDLIREFKARLQRPVPIPEWFPTPGNVKYGRGIRTVERVVHRMIEERRRTGLEGRKDFLSRLMLARDESGAMSDKELRDQAITLLLAGHETTALSLSWAFHLLGSNPETQARLGAELDEVLGGRLPTSEDLPQLKYTEAVIMESMRVYPPAWGFVRESLVPFDIGGQTIPAKTTIFICQWVLHRDGRYFDDPLEFRPERWLGDLEKMLPRYAYMPFGGGPRICVGQRFTMIEAILLLATIAQAYEVEWQSDHKITPSPSITLRPDGGVWVKLKKR